MDRSFALRAVLLLGVVVLALSPLWAAAQVHEELPPVDCQPEDDRVAVLLLGSYHMANPGLDQFNLEADDVLAPERQAQIEAVVAQLAAFAPTKIAIEDPYGDSTAVVNYRQYVRGERTLERSEEEQIGFRLAKRLGHEAVYQIDVRLMLDDAALGPVVAANPAHQARMAELEKLGQRAMAQMAAWLAEGTVGEMLYHMNRPEVLAQAHWPYVWIFAPIAEGDDYAGADLVADWYKRNLRIFANLNRIATPGDRILVIYGQGHIPILRELVQASPDFCLEDSLPYLEGEAK
jgi:hypothetical protein